MVANSPALPSRKPCFTMRCCPAELCERRRRRCGGFATQAQVAALAAQLQTESDHARQLARQLAEAQDRRADAEARMAGMEQQVLLITDHVCVAPFAQRLCSGPALDPLERSLIFHGPPQKAL